MDMKSGRVSCELRMLHLHLQTPNTQYTRRVHSKMLTAEETHVPQ